MNTCTYTYTVSSCFLSQAVQAGKTEKVTKIATELEKVCTVF